MISIDTFGAKIKLTKDAAKYALMVFKGIAIIVWGKNPKIDIERGELSPNWTAIISDDDAQVICKLYIGKHKNSIEFTRKFK